MIIWNVSEVIGGGDHAIGYVDGKCSEMAANVIKEGITEPAPKFLNSGVIDTRQFQYHGKAGTNGMSANAGRVIVLVVGINRLNECAKINANIFGSDLDDSSIGLKEEIDSRSGRCHWIAQYASFDGAPQTDWAHG